jgi:hypothetical protein
VIEIASLNGFNGFALIGVAAIDHTGGPVAGAGDVNGDGLGDLIVGAATADPNGITDAGRSYVVYGRRNHAPSFNLSSLLAANGGDGSAGFVVNGFQAGQNTRPTALGDINGDGFADIRVGAETDDPNGLVDAGRASIVYGKLSPAPVTKFYVVDDASATATYEYSALGAPGESYAIHAGDKVWVVDAKQDKVFRYAGAASRLSGSQNAVSSFALNSANTGPKDIVTDGTNLCVVNDSTTDKVFKYTLSGSLAGSWKITGAGSAPTGITIDPSGGGAMWIVANGSDRIYQFDNARSRTSGSQSPSTSFALAAGNTNPQGIADPLHRCRSSVRRRLCAPTRPPTPRLSRPRASVGPSQVSGHRSRPRPPPPQWPRCAPSPARR